MEFSTWDSRYRGAELCRSARAARQVSAASASQCRRMNSDAVAVSATPSIMYPIDNVTDRTWKLPVYKAQFNARTLINHAREFILSSALNKLKF